MLRQLKPRILCIDDQPSVGGLLRAVFERTGDFFVELETDAYQAIASARRFKPDLIVMDIDMPGRDGFAIARQIRQEPWLRHRPIIFYSGMANGEEASLMAALEGPTLFLRKGVPITVIRETVARLLAERLQPGKAVTSLDTDADLDSGDDVAGDAHCGNEERKAWAGETSTLGTIASNSDRPSMLDVGC